jgi:hypothetical protein
MDPTLALIVGVGAGVLLMGLRSYATEKGKNLATKGDIAEITRQVEGVRAEYSDRVERLKASRLVRVGNDAIRVSQRLWLHAAIVLGHPINQFLVLEWTLSPRTAV